MRLFLILGAFLMQQASAQFFYEQYMLNPVDSAGYSSLYNSYFKRITPWKRADELRLDPFAQFVQFKLANQWGLCDYDLKTVLPCEFSNISNYGSKIIAERANQLLVLDEQFDTLLLVSDFVSLELDLKSTYLFGNNNRDTKTEKTYKHHVIRTKSGCGILNNDLEWVIPPSYDNAFLMDNVIYIRKGSKFGFISREGNIVEPLWSSIGAYNDQIIEVWNAENRRSYFLNDGRAIPQSDSTLVHDLRFNTLKIYRNGKGELFDMELNKLLNYQGEDLFKIAGPEHFEISLDVNDLQTLYAVQRNGKIGVLDSKNNLVIPCQYEDIQIIGKGYFRAMLDGKFGIINHSNKIIVPFNYTYIERKNNYFRVLEFEKAGVLNLDGSVVVPADFQDVAINKFGIITAQNGKHGFFTFDGELVLDPIMGELRNSNYGIEMKNLKGGMCMVNESGLVTDLNCKEITCDQNTLKYYVNDRIVIHAMQNGKIMDTTYYPNNRSLPIRNGSELRGWYSVSSLNYTIHQSQLNGKYGSICHRKIGYAIPPQFDHLSKSALFIFGKYRTDKNYDLSGAVISFKEKIYHLNSDQSTLFPAIHSVVEPHNQNNSYNTSELPALTTENKWVYDDNWRGTLRSFVFLDRMENGISAELQAGELNFNEGVDLRRFRDFYEELNAGYNLIIKSIDEFDRLQRSPMIKVKDGYWKIYKHEQLKSRQELSYAKTFQRFGRNNVIVQDEAGLFYLYNTTNSEFSFRNAKNYELFSISEIPYLLVREGKKIDDNAALYKWNIYTNYGEKILRESADSLRMIGFNAFNVYYSDSTAVVDSIGNVYRINYPY